MVHKPPRVVAELGRPETPQETADRKAENSRKHRANQTVVNLVLALAASLAIVLILVLVVVRPEQPPRDPVDYQAVADQAQGAVSAPLASPELPADWTSNSATLRTDGDGIATWSVGFITPARDFIQLRQGVDANDTWVSNVHEGSQATDSAAVGGMTWEIHDDRANGDAGNLAFAMVAETELSRFVLYGTADDAEFRTLAAAVAAEVTDEEIAP